MTHGHNSSLLKVICQEGDSYVIKQSDDKNARLDLEGEMLEFLLNSGLKVPKIYHKQADFLVMQALESGGPKDHRFEHEAAQALALLHRNLGSHYGFEKTTLIGALDQPNPLEQDWITFFRDHRLCAYARRAMKAGQIDSSLMHDIEALAGKLDQYIINPSPPCLIHGDAWAGNILASPHGGLSGFIDAAIYYADPEIELAFIDLMGGMSREFFKAYDELNEISPEFWEARRYLYQLYPLLVHTILFGRGYAAQVKRIIRFLL